MTSRMTGHRRLVLEVLADSREHLDADTIYQRAKARDAHISLATIYRALAYFKYNGTLIEHQLGEGHGHFELKQPGNHYHFTCKNCGRVIEFEAPQVMDIARNLCASRGLQVSDVHLLLSGYCDACRMDTAPSESYEV
jgi:Fe2+ or Zn2+ uptake regulation protein